MAGLGEAARRRKKTGLGEAEVVQQAESGSEAESWRRRHQADLGKVMKASEGEAMLVVRQQLVEEGDVGDEGSN